MITKGVGVGGWMKKVKGWEVQIGSSNRREAVNYSMGNVVDNIVITLYGARWVLEISGGALCKMCDCLNTMLYTWN